MEFGCSECEYTSCKKDNVIRHINRKKSCGTGIKEIIEIPIKIICEFCDKSFATKQHLTIHTKNNCKQKDKAKDEKIKKLEKLLSTREIIPAPNRKKNSLYILQEREFYNLQQPVYKLGITETIHNRMGQYPKGSKLICVLPVDGDPETMCLQQFRNTFIPRTDVGSEYFEGDIDKMILKLIECLFM